MINGFEMFEQPNHMLQCNYPFGTKVINVFEMFGQPRHIIMMYTKMQAHKNKNVFKRDYCIKPWIYHYRKHKFVATNISESKYMHVSCWLYFALGIHCVGILIYCVLIVLLVCQIYLLEVVYCMSNDKFDQFRIFSYPLDYLSWFAMR